MQALCFSDHAVLYARLEAVLNSFFQFFLLRSDSQPERIVRMLLGALRSFRIRYLQSSNETHFVISFARRVHLLRASSIPLFEQRIELRGCFLLQTSTERSVGLHIGQLYSAQKCVDIKSSASCDDWKLMFCGDIFKRVPRLPFKISSGEILFW